jgi:hypothetical protein
MCLFAVWTGEKEMLMVEKILRDDNFWKNKMIGKLTAFYMEHILPELIDPRQTRTMPLRQPTITLKRQHELPVDAGSFKKPTAISVELGGTRSLDLATAAPTNITQNVLSLAEY